jgi:ADP-heptose:LPS heptosyltransferase
MQKILCIRFSSIGDILLTTPIVRVLKAQFPQAEIHIATKASFAQLWEGNPHVNQVHGFDGNLLKFASALRKEGFDRVYDLHKNLRSHALCLLLGKFPKQIDKYTSERKAFVKTKINTLPGHLVDRNLTSLGLSFDGQGLDYFIPATSRVEPASFGITRPYVLFAMGAAHQTKVLSYPKMIELVDSIPHPVVLIGDDWDAKLGYRLATLFPAKIINLCSKTSIAQSASLIQQSAMVITHDSSMMHVAAALKHPKLYTIWGSTHPGLGFTPYQTPFTAIENTNLACRPCSTQGSNVCPLGHFNCMNSLDLSAIKNAAQAL